jgi:hypothetical protein
MRERLDWFPVLVDDSWVARIRRDYPEQTELLTDDEVKIHYANGNKYYNCNLGDAMEDYESLADEYLKLLKKDFAREYKWDYIQDFNTK